MLVEFRIFLLLKVVLHEASRVLVGKPEGKKPLGRPRCRWEGNIKMELQEVGWGYGLDRAGSDQGQVASTCESGNVPSGSIKCEEFLASYKPVSFSRTRLHGVSK
jgi:hypothetical protein